MMAIEAAEQNAEKVQLCILSREEKLDQLYQLSVEEKGLEAEKEAAKSIVNAKKNQIKELVIRKDKLLNDLNGGQLVFDIKSLDVPAPKGKGDEADPDEDDDDEDDDDVAAALAQPLDDEDVTSEPYDEVDKDDTYFAEDSQLSDDDDELWTDETDPDLDDADEADGAPPEGYDHPEDKHEPSDEAEAEGDQSSEALGEAEAKALSLFNQGVVSLFDIRRETGLSLPELRKLRAQHQGGPDHAA